MDSQTSALARACSALWLATLSLMAAYMRQQAPAHRLLLARRIAANFGTLRSQESFSPQARASFARLHSRWEATAALAARAQHAGQAARPAALVAPRP